MEDVPRLLHGVSTELTRGFRVMQNDISTTTIESHHCDAKSKNSAQPSSWSPPCWENMIRKLMAAIRNQSPDSETKKSCPIGQRRN